MPESGLITRMAASKKVTALAFGLGLLIVLFINAVYYRAMRNLTDTSHLVTHTYEVETALERLSTLIVDAETRQRGYLITGDERYLGPYRAAKNETRLYLLSLKDLTKDNPGQRKRLDALESLIGQKFKVLEGRVRLRQSRGLEAAAQAIRAGIGGGLTDEVRGVLQDMRREEDSLMVERIQNSAFAVRRAILICLAGTAASLVMFLAVYGLLTVHIERRRRAEEEVQKQTELLTSILNSMGEGVAVADKDGKFLIFNPAARRILGMGATSAPPKEWPKVYGTFLPDGKTLFPAEELPLVLAIQGRKVNDVEVFIRNENTLRGVYLSVTGDPLKDKQGNLSGGIVVFRDITERKNVEAKFRGLLEAAPDAMVIVDRRGRIVLVNAQAEKLFGYAREDLLGASLDRLIPERFRQKHEGHAEGFMKTPVARPMGAGLDLFGLRSDGSEFPAEISLSPMESEEGLLVTAAIRDVTDRKKAQTEIKALNEDLKARLADLAAANKELESFSYSVSHDLRAPLRSISGFSQALLEDYDRKLDDTGRQHLKRVCDAVQRMSELIDSMLNLANISRREMRREWVDLSGIAKEILRDLREKEPSRRVECVVAEGLSANGDAQLLRIALVNLLGNAWKYTGKKKEARIEFGSSRDGEGKPAYFVRDNGAGFDMAYSGKLFGAFQRLHAPAEYEGIGIGLATVQRIIHRHGGRVWAQGETGKGATFYFAL